MPAVTDTVTEDYLRRAADPHAPLGRAMDAVTWPPALAAAAGHRLLPRPLFLPAAHLERAADDVVRLFDLLTTLPDLLFDGDLHRYCRALGIDERKEKLVTCLGGATPPMYGRADLAYDGQRFHLLEFNVGSEIGGVDRAGTIPRLLAQTAGFKQFAADHDLAHLDTDRLVAAALRDAARAVNAPAAPTVALLEAPGGLGRFGPVWEAVAELMRGHGIDFLLGEVQQVQHARGRLTLDGRRIDVVLRCFSAEEILDDPGGEDLIAPVLRAHRDGACVLFTPLESALFHNKATLAMLSEAATRGALPADQRDLVDRLLPWTRTLPDRPRPGSALFDRCVEQRAELILKPSARYGGSGVVAGWETTAQAWRRALASPHAGGAVVQARVRPRPEPVADPDSGALRDWTAVWGLFVAPAGCTGIYARAVPEHGGAVVGMGVNEQARTAGVFTYPTAPAPPPDPPIASGGGL